MTSALWSLSAAKQASGVRSGEWSAEELMRSTLDRISVVDPALGAYCTLDDSALDAARRADLARGAGAPLGPLHGVPFSVKDLIPTAGLRTTLGSLAHQDWIPKEDEISVARLRAAGCVLIGKTNARELGYGVVAENMLFGATRNPWDPRMTAAGSSGGAAAAVGAGMGSLALGSDGGGSLRVPASVCGVFAIKPTFGVVPLYPSCRAALRVGLDSWESLGCIGPITRTVQDSALALQAISGYDARDWHAAPSGPIPVGLPRAERAMRLRVAVSPDLGVAEVAPEVADMMRKAVVTLGSELDWEVTTASPPLPSLTDLRELFLTTVAMDTNRRELRKLANTFPVSPDIREIVDREWTTDDFDRARQARRRLCDVIRIFSAPFDAVLTPTTATVAFPVGLRFPRDAEGGIADGRHWSPFAFLSNLTGQPAVSIPIGRTRNGLPVGIQAIGSRFADAVLLDVAQAAEELIPPSDSWSL